MEVDWERVRKVYDDVLEALVHECGIAIGEEECAEPEVRGWLEGMAKIASTVVVALGARDWFVKWGGSLVGFMGADQVWWLSYDLAAGLRGPIFYCLWRPLYDFEDNDVRVPGMEDLTPEILGSPIKWREFELGHPEAARHLSNALRIFASALNRFGVPLVLKFRTGPRETSLVYRALLPDRFRDEDAVRAIEAMVWVYDRLREAGFPLFGVEG